MARFAGAGQRRPVPLTEDGGTPDWRAAPPRRPHYASQSGDSCSLLPLPFLLKFVAAASWLPGMCFEGVMGPPGAVIALIGIAALAALIRRHAGMALGGPRAGPARSGLFAWRWR